MVKRILLFAFMAFSVPAICQTPQVTSIPGRSDCVGATNVFYVTGGTVSNWIINGFYTNLSFYSGNSAVTLTWSAPMNGASITAQLTNGTSVTTGSFSVSAMVTPSVTLSPASVAITAGTSVNFTATSTNAGTPVYSWYLNSQPQSGYTGSTYSNSTLQNGDKVSVSVRSSLACATGDATSNVVTAAVTYPLTLPVVSPVSAIFNTAITINASGAGTNEAYRWYDVATGGSPAGQGLTFNMPPQTANKFYYVSKYNTANPSIESGRVQQSITLTIPPPDLPQVSNNSCGPKTLTRGTPPSLIVWYWQGTNPTGTSVSNSSSTYTVDMATHQLYYIRARAAGIWSSAVGVDVSTDTYAPVDITLTSYSTQNNTAEASNSIVLKPGFSVTSGNNFNARISSATLCNDIYNWSEQIVYDESGVPLARSRSYVSGMGMPLQTQASDPTSGMIWVTQPLYDHNNLATASTLPAPIQENDFTFKRKFINNTGLTPYNADDFDAPITTNNTLGEIKNPKPVDNTIPYTLGWYYSANNTLEPNTATTTYPYGRSYTPEGPDPTTTTSASMGDQYKMGSGHEAKADRQLFNSTELTHYLSRRSQFVPVTTMTYTGTIGYKYISTDADGKMQASFTDADGNTLASAVITNASLTSPVYDYWSYNYYNDMGQLVASVAPNGINTSNSNPLQFITTYKYDHLGRLIETTSPDEGTSRFVYSNDGKLRFSENQTQREASPKRFSYTNYDYLGRLIESGEYTSSGTTPYLFEPQTTTATPAATSVLSLIDNVGFINLSNKVTTQKSRCTDYTFIEYDIAGSGYPTSTGHTVQNNTFGQISKTENANAMTWYSYDEFGQMIWSKQTINTLGTKTIDYTYDYYGNVTKVAYTGAAAAFDNMYHFYTYDKGQRLTEVYTSRDGTNKTLQAKYYYYLHGPLKRVELATNLQGIDYTYTLQGELKSINHMDITNDPGADGLAGTHSGFSKDVFGLTLSYFDNDFTSGGHKAGNISPAESINNYSGLVKAVGWSTPVDNTPAKRAYSYTYDNVNQLQNARWGTVTGTNGNYATTLPGTNPYREGMGAVPYDKNGNIQSMVRNGRTGNSIANYGYVYEANTNRVDKINDGAALLIDYTYNSIGQMIQYTEAGISYKVNYNAYGLVKEVLKGTKMLESIYYDDRGDKVQKTNYNDAGAVVKTTFYAHDVSGNVMAVYEQVGAGAITIKELPVYGGSRLGEYKPTPTDLTKGNYFFEINDHLGNVRAVIGAPFTDTITATMETESMATEDKNFKNIAPRSAAPFALKNGPNGGDEAIYLNNLRITGPAAIIPVAPGDVITVSTAAYYEGGTGYSSTTLSSVIVSSIITAFGGVIGAPGDPGKIFDALNGALTGSGFAGLAGSGDDNVPGAYLNMIMFDNNMISDPASLPMSAIPVTSAANMNKQTLTIGPVTMPTGGYIYVYVNNNSNSANKVYFDDLTITQLHSPFVAGGDYYPYGLTMEDRQIKIEPYRYGYQGQFSEKDLTTGLNEFELRNYDARFGRWLSPDPYGQYESPYIGMGNAPNMTNDSDGGYAGCPPVCPEIALTGIVENTLETVILPGVMVKSISLVSERILPELMRVSIAFPKALNNLTAGVSGFNRSIVGDLWPEYGGDSRDAINIRAFGEHLGYGFQIIAAVYLRTPTPGSSSQMVSLNGPTFSIAQPITAPSLIIANGQLNAGESQATKDGRAAHDKYNPGPTYTTSRAENRLPSGRIPDAIDWENKIVRELKPNTRRAFKRGLRQVRAYRDELQKIWGGVWKWNVDFWN